MAFLYKGLMTPIPSADDPYIYRAQVVRVIDGDTVRLKLSRLFKAYWDFGFYIIDEVSTVRSVETNCRLLGINTPEITGVPLDEKARGVAATQELVRLLSLGELVARTSKPDKYGRWLVELWVRDPAGAVICVNESLIENGFAKAYVG
jgi:endonuclease YncB( thermonuclease family)